MDNKSIIILINILFMKDVETKLFNLKIISQGNSTLYLFFYKINLSKILQYFLSAMFIASLYEVWKNNNILRKMFYEMTEIYFRDF